MKKIFITGVLLVLLIIITADLYNDHKRANDQRNELQATNATTGNSAALPAATAINTNESTNNNTNNVIGAQDAATTVSSYKHHRQGTRTNSAMNSVDGDMLLTTTSPDDGGMVAVLDESEAPAIAAESSKNFYGNFPVKKETVSEHHRSSVHFAPEIGLMQNSYYHNSSSDLLRYGLRAGGIVDIGLGNHFALQPGILYEEKGVEMRNVYSNSFMEEDTKDKIDLHYIQMPLNLVVKFGDWHDGRIIAGVGPYLAYLVNAQDKYQATTYTFNNSDANPAGRTTLAANSGSVVDNKGITVEGQRSIRVGGDANVPEGNNLRTLDWGINGFVGCEMPSGFYAKAGTEVGLRNIQGNTDGTYSGRNYNFFLSVGYLIGYKR